MKTNFLLFFVLLLAFSCDFVHPAIEDEVTVISHLYPGSSIDEVKTKFDEHMAAWQANPNAGITAKSYCDRTNTVATGDYGSAFGRFIWCHIPAQGEFKVDLSNYSGSATNFDVQFHVAVVLSVSPTVCSGNDSYGNPYYKEVQMYSAEDPGNISSTTTFDVEDYTCIETCDFTFYNPFDDGATSWTASWADIISNKTSDAAAINFFYDVYVDPSLTVFPNTGGVDYWSHGNWDQSGSYSTNCDSYNMEGLAN
jgi:hypothetical protein